MDRAAPARFSTSFHRPQPGSGVGASGSRARFKKKRTREPPEPILECGGLTPLFHPALDQPKAKPLREEVTCGM
jgi:hypothetical protein